MGGQTAQQANELMSTVGFVYLKKERPSVDLGQQSGVLITGENDDGKRSEECICGTASKRQPG